MPAGNVAYAKTAANQSERLSGPALRAFAGVADAWGLATKERQILLGLPPSTFHKYQLNPDAARLSKDTLERISYVVGIFKALQILLPTQAAADEWIRRENAAPVFNGRTALQVMLGGQVSDLFRVRDYLDSERGW